MDQQRFKELASEYSAVPVWRTLLADTLTPVSLFMKLREGADAPFLLESVEGGEHVARYSFLGRDPYQRLIYQNGEVSIRAEGKPEQRFKGDYLDTLKELTQQLNEPEIPDLPRLTGGAVGYSAYDTIRLTEHLPNEPEDDLNLPDAVWSFYDEIYAFDHVKHRVLLIKTVFPSPDIPAESWYQQAVEALDRMEEQAKRPLSDSMSVSLEGGITSNTTKEAFCDHVEKAKSRIFEGDIFQVVLSQRFETRFQGDRFMLYRALRMANPSPYLFYLDYDDYALVGSSPEVLVRVENGKAGLMPIAGTRPRGKTQQEDLDLEDDLKHDPKEIAEHIMLVDLGRNDLTRVCKPETVKVTRNQLIERYSRVMHIVSEVEGELHPDNHPVDALRYCFPAGTVSGAPKVRAMEIIDELEPTRRGPYAGAVGYIDFSGNLDTCIAIRTILATRDRVYIQAGAGIVADSEPVKEFEETENKAKALFDALDIATLLDEESDRVTK